MRMFRFGIAALAALALAALTPALMWGAGMPTAAGARAHSDAWHDSYLDRDGATHVVFHLATEGDEAWRGGMAAQRALETPAQPRRTARVAHGEEWDSKYLDRNVNRSIKSPVIDYQNPSTMEGCHAQADHRIQLNRFLVAAQY